MGHMGGSVVELLTLDFCSGPELRVVRLSSTGGGAAGDSLPPSISAPSPFRTTTMTKNRYVSESYFQGRSWTLCPKGVLKGVVKQKERMWELGSQKVMTADLSKMAVWFTYHLFKSILINELMYLCSVSSHDYQWFLVGPFQIWPITETQNLGDE